MRVVERRGWVLSLNVKETSLVLYINSYIKLESKYFRSYIDT